MKLLSLFTFILLFSNAFAQRRVILSSNTSGWAYHRALADDHQQFKPEEADPDFWETWIDHSFGSYTSPLTYDGPAFFTNQQAPFFAGNVPGIQGGTSLDLPADATWQYGYFLKEINGGTTGYKNLNLKILARDGAFVYLNGQYLGATPTLFERQGENPRIYREGDGTTFVDLNLAPSIQSFLRPGPNLLAVVAGRASSQTEDFGLKIELTGELGIPPITPITENIEGNRIHLRWSTAVPQKTIVKIDDFTFGVEPEIFESETATRNHYFTHEAPIANDQFGSTIRYQILKPNFQIWDEDFVNGLRNSTTFSAPGYEQKTLFTHDDNDWSYLQVRDSSGNDIDPALSDSDFHQTWFRQIPAGFGTPPFDAVPYDGPAFTKAPTPIHYGVSQDFPSIGTELTPPAGGEGHTLWLFREIDGGPGGYNDLELSLRLRGEADIYLNGKLIHQTDRLEAPETWPFPSEVWHYTRTKEIPLYNSYLNAGPNLLAIAVHHAPGNLSKLGFSAELKASTQPIPVFRDLKETLFGNTFTIEYLTGTLQPTDFKIGPTGGDLSSLPIPGERVFHRMVIPNLEENTPYTYQIIVPYPSQFPFDPPTQTITGQFTPTSTTLIAEESDDWQVLHSLDNEGLGMDPGLMDPDFNTTWMTLGMSESLYDGPAFTPNQSAPFRISGTGTGHGGTTLAHPGQDRSGAVYLIKEITAPEKGAWSLDFNVATSRAYQIYVNGELIIDDLGLNQPSRSWDLYWQDQARRPSSNPASLHPGKNILAISLHPQNQETPPLDFDLTLAGRTDFTDAAQMLPLAPPYQGEMFTTIQWFTDIASSTLLRYGVTRNDLRHSISTPHPTFVHTAHLPNSFPGQRVYYEILQSDGSSYDPPSINSFVDLKTPLIPLESTWYSLNPRDPSTDVSIDPATLDPDFYQTWSTQSIGTFPGNTTYDGPTFLSPLPAPFGPEFSNAATIIKQPGAAWFLKEVDGGASGFHDLELESNGDTCVTVFLNGNKIGETYTPIASQAIWAQAKYRYTVGSNLRLPKNLILPPGPNLIAIQMHISHASDADVFDISLSGTSLENVTTPPFPIKTTTTSADLSWSTAQAQPTRLRWGPSPSSLSESTEVTGDRNFHALTLSDLDPSTTYFVEVLDPTGSSFNPPNVASFRTEDPILVARESAGWSVLESTSGGVFVDPAIADSDFLTTWLNPAAYNGPDFTPNRSSPFVSQGHHFRPGETVLQSIDSKIRPVWLLKQIDGGASGYHSLTLDGILFAGASMFLNGQPFFTRDMTETANAGAWDQAGLYNSNSSSNFSEKLPATITIPPGPSLLAIALHPYQLETNGGLAAEFELRGIPQKFTITDPVIGGLDFTNYNLSWTTTAPATTRVNYGLAPLSLDLASESSDLKTDHQISFPETVEGGTYTYEILATDALGNTATFTGSFDISPRIMREPFLQNASPTSMSIRWRARDLGEVLVRYGTDPSSLDQIAVGTSEPAPIVFSTDGFKDKVTDRTVTITGLTPATKYYYQVAFDNNPAPATDLDQSFTTAPLPGTPAPTRIWVIGDSGYAGQGVRDVKDAYLQYTAQTPTNVWLMLGDNAYNSGYDSEYQTALFNIFPELLKSTPVWPTMGNHDGRSKSYYRVFDLPTNGQSGGIPSGTEKYYSFDHGNIHFICLNSEEDPAGMLDWLTTDLQSTRADWIIAFFHHGPYTKGTHDSDRESEHFRPREAYLPILESYGVDLVLAGHSHQYERSHLLNGHYSKSFDYREVVHSLDSGPGSSRGYTDRQSGLFQYSSEFDIYQKSLATPNSGQVSATVGASSSVGSWSDTANGDRSAITHPNRHPVHVATIRALGSMVIDVDGRTLRASYLDSNGQIRDEFQINKVPDESPAITWWQKNFGAGSYPYFADWFDDADHDTNSNLAEYIHGGDPLQSDQLIQASITVDGLINDEPAQWFSIRYDLREGTQATVEHSENLVNFYQSEIETRRLEPPNAQGIAPWESRIRRTDDRSLFFRLKTSR